MAINFVNEVGNGYNAGGGDLTIAGVVNSGADYLTACLHQFDSNAMASPAVAWNGDALTIIGTVQKLGGNDWISVYYLLAPDVGSFNLVFDRTDSNRMSAVSACYSGALQSGQPDAQTGGIGTGTSASSSLASVADNCWHVFCVLEFSGAASPGSNVTQRSVNSLAALYLYDSNGPKTPAGALTQSSTFSPSTGYGYKQFTIAPAVAAGPTTVKTFDGVTQATGIKSYFGAVTASVKTVDGAS